MACDGIGHPISGINIRPRRRSGSICFGSAGRRRAELIVAVSSARFCHFRGPCDPKAAHQANRGSGHIELLVMEQRVSRDDHRAPENLLEFLQIVILG